MTGRILVIQSSAQLFKVGEKMVKYNTYKIFHDKVGNEYLFLVNNNSLFRLDERSKTVLSMEGLEERQVYDKLSEKMSYDEIKDLFDNMKKIGLLVFEQQSVSNKVKELELSPMGVTLMIVQECNLRCTYCYGDGGEYQDKGKMSLEVAQKSIDFLVANTKIRIY